jgi:tRNA pseudouridine38-40 synthase
MRYFLEVSYKGTNYAGFQIQKNAVTVQGEIEKALATIFRININLTGASRTDAGVHALQNYFHFDIDFEWPGQTIYNLNAILPNDIVVKAVTHVADSAHCRFHALSREYSYYISFVKNPFLIETAWFYPYKLHIEALQAAASSICNYTNFTSFSKRNTQAYTNLCTITKSNWRHDDDKLVYNVKSNRFLRGMVRGLVGTMLQVGRGTLSLYDFNNIIEAHDCTKANFSTPAKGLFLTAIEYPSSILPPDPQKRVSLSALNGKV